MAETVRDLIAHWRWAAAEGRGGMDPYIRVRDAAQKDAFGRSADELERQASAGNEALLALASRMREQCLRGDVPQDVKDPAWPGHRPAPQLDAELVQREQRLGFALGLALCASHLHEAAGGEG